MMKVALQSIPCKDGIRLKALNNQALGIFFLRICYGFSYEGLEASGKN